MTCLLFDCIISDCSNEAEEKGREKQPPLQPDVKTENFSYQILTKQYMCWGHWKILKAPKSRWW